MAGPFSSLSPRPEKQRHAVGSAPLNTPPSLLFPLILPLPLNVKSRSFQVGLHVTRVLFVAHFEDHFYADPPQRRQPDRTLMIYLDNVCAGFRDAVQH